MSPQDLATLRLDLEREKCRRSLATFVRLAWPIVEPRPLKWSWHMDAICAHLEAISRGYIRDLVISVPPGTSKSLISSTLWEAWDWIDHPTRSFLTATYGQDLSDKNAKLHRDLVLDPWYVERWPMATIGKADSAKVRLFQNLSKGFRISTSVGGQATGRHVDVILGDDLVKAQDAEGRAAIDPVAIEKANDFWFKTLQTRRADAVTTARVLIAQRLHHEDTVGRAIDAGYVSLVLPMEFDERRRCATRVNWVPSPGAKPVPFVDPRTAPRELLAPERFPQSVVDEDRIRMGPQTFEAQNQQDPTPIDGLLFKGAGDARWTEVPKDARQIITVDATFKDTSKSDFVSIQCWAVKRPYYYLIDNHTERLSFGKTVDAIRRFRDVHPKASGVYIEDKANGPAIIDTLKEEMSGIQPWEPKSSKTARAEAVAPLFSAGHVLLPPDSEAPWLQAYLKELRKFPLTKHDDQVDATTMALLILHLSVSSKYLEFSRKMREAG